MCFRATYLNIFLFTIIKETYAAVHISDNLTIPCEVLQNKQLNFKEDVDSYLLMEGESLTLECGVCAVCANKPPECKQGYDPGDWKIQTTRYLGYDGRGEEKIDHYTSDLFVIRLRLHERIWPRFAGLPPSVQKIIHSQIGTSEHPANPSTLIADNVKKGKQNEQNLTRPLLNAPGLYIFVAKPTEPGYVLTDKKHSKLNRIQLIRDKVVIKQTRMEDTGMYYCYYNGRKIREWAVTVTNALDEPFRYLPRKIDYDSAALAALHENGNNSESNESLTNAQDEFLTTPLQVKRLLNHNLKLHTEWSSWTQCAPCTPDEQLPRSEQPGGNGFQLRVGLCRLTILDPFHSVRPHDLALQIDQLLRLHYRRGLPCRSHLIRDAIRLFGPKISIMRPNEIMVRECVRTCDETHALSTFVRYKVPKRVQIRVNEGESLVISCPVRGAVRGPISWFYSPADMSTLINLTNSALSKEYIESYGSPSNYLTTLISPVNIVKLFEATRGRFRFDQAYNLIMAEAIANPSQEEETRLHHLICVHGDARAKRIYGFSDWAGIIEIEVVPRTYAVVVLSKMSQVVMLLIPFALALGTFVVIAVTLHTERKPNMRAAADGFTNKPPP